MSARGEVVLRQRLAAREERIGQMKEELASRSRHLEELQRKAKVPLFVQQPRLPAPSQVCPLAGFPREWDLKNLKIHCGSCEYSTWYFLKGGGGDTIKSVSCDGSSWRSTRFWRSAVKRYLVLFLCCD